jgi:hypothetical protein
MNAIITASTMDRELLRSAPPWRYRSDPAKYAGYSLEQSPSFHIDVHLSGETTTVVDRETGVFGIGASPREALDDFRRAVREHLDVLERQESLSDDLTAQFQYLRERLL